MTTFRRRNFLFCGESKISNNITESASLGEYGVKNGEIEDLARRRRQEPYGSPVYMAVKRSADILISITFLVVLFPVFVVIMLLIAMVDGFPTTYKSPRIGRFGKQFYAFKFRTMVKNADEVLRADPVLYEEYKRTFKLKNDPRITKIGKFLRATSMDEFPQLINVLRGEMSIVGPRPILLPERDRLNDPKDPYPKMLPGCAGLWQCSGRADTTYAERVRLDQEYFQNASIWLDISILVRTAWSILKREGAC